MIIMRYDKTAYFIRTIKPAFRMFGKSVDHRYYKFWGVKWTIVNIEGGSGIEYATTPSTLLMSV